MGYNSQSNIMKKLLLLGIIALAALCTACEKDEPEDKSTNGIDISTLDINDPNFYYWTYSYKDSDDITRYGCEYITSETVIKEFSSYYLNPDLEFTIISKSPTKCAECYIGS